MRSSAALLLVLAVAAISVQESSGQAECPASSGSSCFYDRVAITPAPVPTPSQGEFYLGGLFDVYQKGGDAFSCGSATKESGVVNMMAFFWAIARYRESVNAPSVGGIVFDTCERPEQAVSTLLGFEQCSLRVSGVDRRKVMAFVGPQRSDVAMAVGKLTPDLNLTTVSPSATSAMLSDASMYPYFLRTISSDVIDADVIASIFQELKFRYLMVVYQDDELGRAGMERLRQHFPSRDYNNDKCITYSASLPATPNATKAAQVVGELLERYRTRYVALLLDAANTRLVLDQVASVRASAQKLRFLGGSQWGSNPSLALGRESHAANSLVLSRSIPDTYRGALDDFRTYWRTLKPTTNQNAWFRRYWEEKFQCSLTGNINTCNVSAQSLSSVTPDEHVANTIMAVDVALGGIREAAKDACNGFFQLCSELMNADSRGPRVFERIKRESRAVENIQAQVFNNSVDSQGRYLNGDLSRDFVTHRISRVLDNGDLQEEGTFSRNMLRSLSLNTSAYQSPICTNSPCLECGEQATTTVRPTDPSATTTMASTTTDPLASGNVTLVAFPPGQHITGAYSSVIRRDDEYGTRFDLGHMWIIALGVLAGLGIVAVIVFEIYILMKLLGSNFIHKWRTMWLGQLLLFGILLCYLTLIAYIWIPTKATCGITRFGVGVSYAVCFSVLLVKLMVILTSKSSESLLPGDVESPNYLKGIYQFLMFVFATGVQVVIAIQWLITVPPEAVKVLDNRGVAVWICNHYTWDASNGMGLMSSFVRSEFENHVLSLVYIMFLILITTLLALNAHGIITNHRESVFIGISAGFSIPIWLAWTLVGGLNRDKAYAQEFGDASIAFGLFLTATLILFAMFLPKVRQLVNMGVEGIYFEDDRDTYAGSVIMAPPSYKSRPNSVIYVNNNGIYSEPVVLGSGDPSPNHLRHPGSTYSMPVMRKTPTGSLRGAKTLMITGDLTGKPRPASKSEIAYGTPRRPVSERGTLRRARSQQDLGAL